MTRPRIGPAVGAGAHVDLSEVRLLVCVSGSVAALAVPHILLWLTGRLGLKQIRVLLTPMALRLVTKDSFRRVVGCEVMCDWDDLPLEDRSHVSVARWAQVGLVMPATADLVGKLAHGIADDLVSSTLMAVSCPTVVVPSTSETTWNKPVMRRNVAQLRADGFDVVEPRTGHSLATGADEQGSMGDYRPPLIAALARAAGHLEPVPSAEDASTSAPVADAASSEIRRKL
ncbi:phosphopantothenate--cysteine ligase family flavoprotein [Nonomuraea sp. NPDC049158]|uniref:phosphopantothenate--cysteine ligase family flavoprotein n=1 Tax=Nonomuraea sp. NPDC049158 TaxID=3155649 RepID=UPI0033C19E25